MSEPPIKGRYFELSIEGAGGKFVPIRQITPAKSKRPTIVCVPTPCSGGFEYVPDWWGITHHG